MKRNVGKNVVLEKNVELDKNAVLQGNCYIGEGCKIIGQSILTDVVLGAGCLVEHSVLKESQFGKNCKVGPFANIRPGCLIADNVKIGSMVEVKNSIVGKGTKIPHLSYVGDAEIGNNVNIGCGVVFANYNGKIKQKSKIGNNVFIGSNVNIVAPVKIADDSYIAAGTTVTKDTEKGDFVIGRTRQENKKRQK